MPAEKPDWGWSSARNSFAGQSGVTGSNVRFGSDFVCSMIVCKATI